ncbi:MAG: c-type cytochrome [Pseudomonadota bacterium]
MLRRLILAVAALAVALAPAAAVERLTGHGGPIMAADAYPDGRILTGSFDNSIGLWTNGMPRWLEGHRAAVKTVLALPDGRAASGGDDFDVILWAADGTPTRLSGHRGPVADLALSPDGETLASAGWDGRIGLWRLADGAHLGWLTGHQGPVTAVVYDGDLFSASADGTVRRWSGDTGRAIVRHGFGVNTLSVADGVLAYGAVDGGTRAIDLLTEAEVADLTLGRRPILAFARDGNRLAVGDGEGHVMVVDTATWSIMHDFRAAARGPVWALAFVGEALVAGGIDDTAFVWTIGADAAPQMALSARSFQRDPSEMSNGERQFQRKCSVCHVLTGDTARKAGPTLDGVFGRRAGTLPGYTYSQTLRDSTIVWSPATLNALFDEGPDRYIPGSNMPLQRITREADRRDLINFLENHTGE